ncbi:uncharacterized protein [Spinacia oleracea]|uniref:Uncharacterized protein isoform X2 n=1 Tax=Spinacia oleracea TaxID=3562 RepID=A0ABM3R875_SPIOL|nr:uncharacterized protein LOC110792512 isoform X2 [Spinacia oleracea]
MKTTSSVRIGMEGGKVVSASASVSDQSCGGCGPSAAAASSSSSSSSYQSCGGCGPFSGLIICVSGLSKESRKQVMEATERLGGKYTPNLHPNCTHLLVQSLGGHKLKHALNHGFRNKPFVVTLGWFIDCVNNNVKLDELPYTFSSVAQPGFPIDETVVLSPTAFDDASISASGGNKGSHLFGHSIYIDLDVPAELHNKVVDVATREGAVLVDQWFVGCGASYVVCEGSSIQRYLGHSDNIPIWVLKTSTERSMQRFVGLSADLARHMGVMLENLQCSTTRQDLNERCHEHILTSDRRKLSQKERLQNANLAKCGVRNRRARRLQPCHVPLRPINPSSLLDSLCWSISEPSSRASVYADSLKSNNDVEIHKHGLSAGGDCIESEASFSNLLRPLKESEKNELVFKNHFLTILYPVDRFAELGPSSRTYFSDTGFTCLQLLDFIYAFYQENMSDDEIEVAIHTDSRHADQLRSVYCSERTELGCVMDKRIEFLGSRKSFEMLKRVSGDNNSNVYELLIRE